MKKNIDVIRAWKDPAYRNQLTGDELAALPEHPAGGCELDSELLSAVSGGMAPSQGWWCTISAECNGGNSCNPFPW